MARALKPPGPPPEELSRLRPELRVHAGAPSASGAQSWVIEDPLRHRFVAIDAATRDLLSLFREFHTRDGLMAAAWDRLALRVSNDDVDALIAFLSQHELLLSPVEGGWRVYANRGRPRSGMLMSLVHHYLFFRVPLFCPDAFLSRTLALVEPFFSRAFAFLTLFATVTGLYLVVQQWDQFISTFSHLSSWSGMIALGVSIVVVKALHELGHAYVAKRYGCKVSTIGVAFMLLTPLLYTDVSDAWRLRDRRKRLMIDSAGVTVELVVAAYATVAWAFLPEGPMKSVAFMLATAGWLLSLAINLNPFMRFDGYYILSEICGVENLQPRAFALGRWALRSALFDLREPCPEAFSRPSRIAMIAYAYATWIYRLFLFVGIAVLVYIYTFKALGVLLFAAEIVFLVLRPIVSEMMVWWKKREAIMARRRIMMTGAVMAALTAVVVVPWSTSVQVPSVLTRGEMRPVFVDRPAQLIARRVREGDTVVPSTVLFTFHDPDLAQRLKVIERKLVLARLRLGRLTADKTDRGEALVLQREQTALEVERAGIRREMAELHVRAGARGRVLQLAPNLHAGLWVGPDVKLAVIGDATQEAVGYLSESDAARVAIGAQGRFIPDAPLAPALPVSFKRRAVVGAERIGERMLTSQFGGAIAVSSAEDRALRPVTAQYRATFDVVGTAVGNRQQRGVIHLTGRAESLLARAWRQTLKVLAREAGA